MHNTRFIAICVCIFQLTSAWAQPNERPPIDFTPASSLLPKCKIAVQFNEDERSVREIDYIAGAYCLGLVRGILGTNEYLGPASLLFCIPATGVKSWQAAKRLVLFAEARPELLDLPETEFAVRALRNSFPCRLSSLEAPSGRVPAHGVSPQPGES